MRAPVIEGSRFGAYQIEAMIGRGGMAEVYRAEHVHLRRSVAFKVLSAEMAGDAEYRERFLRESRLAASIHHANLVTIFDAGEIDGVLFLAMQYVNGGDLRTLLQREGRLRGERAYALLAQIAAGLDVAHAHGLVHRDVKPANVLLERGNCYVADFGLTKAAVGSGALTQVGEIVGTMVYAPPEQINGEAVDHRADIYALGCVAFELLTGSLPFDRPSLAALMFAHLSAPPPRPSEACPELPVAVDDVLANALAKAPGDRYDSAGEFVQALCVALGVRERSPSSLVRATPLTGVVDAPEPEVALPRSLTATSEAPLVGRGAQLAALRGSWSDITAGSCALAAVRGEAGIGKTRLAAEFARAVHADGGLVLYGRCDDVLAVPYQPFVQALRPLVDALGPERVRRDVGGLTGELSRLWPDLGTLGEPLHSDPESERFVLFEAVAALLAAATRVRPGLLVLDDVHWAAGPTVLLLRHLLRSDHPARLLVIATFRDTDLRPDDPLATMLADLYRTNATAISVTGIDDAAIAALLPAMDAGVDPQAAAELARALQVQTGGNPFFLGELLRELVESGALGRDGAAVPESVRQVIGQRVARLSEPARRLLSAASIASGPWSFTVLERALGEPPDLLDALEEALRAGLIVEAEADEHVFAHALVRQTLYDELGAIRAMRLHKSFGEALEAAGDPDEHVEELAHHFTRVAEAGGSAKAAAYALLAGRRAQERLGSEVAVEHYRRGLDAIARDSKPDLEQRSELLLALAAAYWATGDVDGVRAAAGEAAQIAELRGDGERLARAALVYGGPLFFSARDEVLQLIERALAALPETDSALRAQLLARLTSSFGPGDDRRRAELADQALDMARRIGDKPALADVLAVTRLALRGPDELDSRAAAAHELAAVADEIADARLRGFAHEWLLNHALELADVELADREYSALKRLADARVDRHLRWLVHLLDARQALLEGRLEECERLAFRALEVAGVRPGAFNEGPNQAFSAQLIYVRLEQGRLIELLPQVEAFVRDFGWVSGWRCALAYVYALLGRTDDAREQFEQLAQAGFEDIPRDALWLLAMAHLSEVASDLQDSERAECLYRLLEPYGDRCIVALGACCLGSVARSLGRLATVTGRYEAAAAHLERAIAVNTHIRSPVWTAHAQIDYAQLLLRSGDAAAAEPWLERALTTAGRLSLKEVEARAQRLVGAGAGAVQPSGTGSMGDRPARLPVDDEDATAPR